MKPRNGILLFLLLGLAVFLGWRFTRPMNIFVVGDRFAWPIDTSQVPPVLGKLRAVDCAACHQTFYKEWRTTMHSQAWVDPYFQTDWQFDDARQNCRLCHTPLDRQQPHTVLGYRDKDKWDPVLEENPDFAPELQHEGVTCAACHYRDGKIVGVLSGINAPHPVKKLKDPNQVCVRCHIVEGDRWDTFYRFPPCGTVAEIESDPDSLSTQDTPEAWMDHSGRLSGKPVPRGNTGEKILPDTASLGCVQCHMPLVQRPLVAGGRVRPVRQHLWHGGHDPVMVKQGLKVQLAETEQHPDGERKFILTITNVGAAHYLPTGTPDRFLTVELRLLDREDKVLKEQGHRIKRTVLWRPFIIDLKDTRLPRWQPRRYEFSVPAKGKQRPVAVEAVVRYHLLDEKRRKRIGYENREPIAYEVFRQTLSLAGS